MYFIKEVDKDKVAGVNINLDAKTGELIHFYQELDQDKNAKPSINKDQALTLAKEYIKKKLVQIKLIKQSILIMKTLMMEKELIILDLLEKKKIFMSKMIVFEWE